MAGLRVASCGQQADVDYTSCCCRVVEAVVGAFHKHFGSKYAIRVCGRNLPRGVCVI